MTKFIGLVFLCVLSILESSFGARHPRAVWEGDYDLWYEIPTNTLKQQFEQSVTDAGIVMILAGVDNISPDPTTFAYRAAYADLNRIKRIAKSLKLVLDEEVPVIIEIDGNAVWEAYFGIATDKLRDTFEERVKATGIKMEREELHTYPDGSIHHVYHITVPDLQPVFDIAGSLKLDVGSYSRID